LGTGDGNPRNIPVQVGLDNSWKSVYGGVNYSLGIKNDGSLWSWGENGKGQLGIGVDLGIDISPRVTPQRVGSSNDWSYATCGNHALALKSDGSLWAWGNNDVGALGDGTTIVRSAPIKIGTSTWKTISAGNLHSLGIKTDGTLWVWGYNFNYQLGDGTKVDRYEPMQVGTASNFKSISAGGEEFSIAIDALGSRWATGANSRGQLGDGTGVLKRYFTETVCESLGIKDIATTENITVYPNPFKESLKINGLGMLNSIQLFDVSGKLLLEKRNINAENFTLHTVEIAQGAYVLIVETPIGSTKIKVVK
jgi:alpha-tubulin suppressor-like RCC1 family protein